MYAHSEMPDGIITRTKIAKASARFVAMVNNIGHVVMCKVNLASAEPENNFRAQGFLIVHDYLERGARNTVRVQVRGMGENPVRTPRQLAQYSEYLDAEDDEGRKRGRPYLDLGIDYTDIRSAKNPSGAVVRNPKTNTFFADVGVSQELVDKIDARKRAYYGAVMASRATTKAAIQKNMTSAVAQEALGEFVRNLVATPAPVTPPPASPMPPPTGPFTGSSGKGKG